MASSAVVLDFTLKDLEGQNLDRTNVALYMYKAAYTHGFIDWGP